MGVLDKMGDAISTVSKDVVNKAKAGSDVSKIKQQIAYEEDKIVLFYTELGKMFYEIKFENMNEDFVKVCDEIDAHISRIERLKKQINIIKGVKICPSCGSVVNDNFLFCGICGAKLPDNIVENVNQNNSNSVAQNRETYVFSEGK